MKHNATETYCLHRTSISETFSSRSDQLSETAAFPRDHLLEICCLSDSSSIGDLLRFLETYCWRLAAFPWDHLFCRVSLRPSIGDLLRFRQTSLQRIATSLLDKNCGDLFCLRVPTATFVVSIRQRSRKFALFPTDQSSGDLLCRYLQHLEDLPCLMETD